MSHAEPKNNLLPYVHKVHCNYNFFPIILTTLLVFEMMMCLLIQQPDQQWTKENQGNDVYGK